MKLPEDFLKMFPDIRPEIIDMVPMCSCYISTTDAVCGDCPQYERFQKGSVKFGNYKCKLQGTIHGKICTPFIKIMMESFINIRRAGILVDEFLESGKFGGCTVVER